MTSTSNLLTPQRMRRPLRQPALSQPDPASSWILRSLAVAGTSIPIAVLPWLFGGVRPSIYFWLLIGVLVSLVCYLFVCVQEFKSSLVSFSTGHLPLLAALGLAAFQLVPLPAEVLVRVAPRNLEAWRSLSSLPTYSEVLVGSKTAVDVRRPLRSISLYPAATRRDASLLAAATAIFFLGASLFRRTPIMLGLLGAVAANGMALGFFGIAQQMRWTGLIYGLVPVPQNASPFASFVNRNSGAGFLNICLACAVGLAVYAFSDPNAETSPRKIELAVLRRGGTRGSVSRLFSGLLLRLQVLLLRIDGLKLFTLVAVVVIFTAVVFALSRGAWIALGAAAVVTTLAVYLLKRKGAGVLAIILACVAGFVLLDWLGQIERIRQRSDTLWQLNESRNARLEHWRDCWDTALHYLPFGSGLGTHPHAYQAFRNQVDSAWFYHAENQYIEALVDGGAVGLVLLLMMIALMGLACWRLMKEPGNTVTYAIGVAGVFALTSQVVHSFLDFGMYMPANMATLALLCGTICGRTSQLAFASSDGDEESGRRAAGRADARPGLLRSMARSLLAIRLRPLPAFAIVLLLLVTTAAGSLDCYRLAAVQAKMRDAGDPVSFPTQSVGQLTQHIVELERVVARRPDDAEGQMRLAQLWLALQPARNLALVEWEKLPADKRKEVAEQVWQESSPRALHERATMLERESRTYELLQLRNSPFVLTDVAQAARHILLARNACPVMPLPHLALAQLSPLLPSLGRDVYHLEHLRRVAHLDLPMLSESSVLELQSRRSDQLLQDWRVLGRYKPERLPQMVTFLIEQLQLGEKIELVLPDDPLPLAHLARAELAESVRQPVREAVVSKLKKLITSDETPDNLFLQAVLASLQNNRAAAVANMTQAIALHPRDAEWRYQFALMLEADGQLAEARKQASMCARLVPEDPRYEALLKHLIESELTVP